MVTTYNLEIDNQMSDTQELLQERLVRLTDEDYAYYQENLGLDFTAITDRYVESYDDPSNDFMRNLKMQMMAGRSGGLSLKQRRAALNVWWEHLNPDATRQGHTPEGNSTLPPQRQQCFTCKDWFDNMTQLLDHKAKVHTESTFGHHPSCKDNRHAIDEACILTEAQPEETPVIAVQDSKLLLDLSSLQDGRYAVPDLTGKNDYAFLMVKRVRRTHWRDRRYVYGKIITGGEAVMAGTIEVKIWSSDTKELIGEQKPGELYKGKFEIELNVILKSPATWAKLFGTTIGRCGICGKTLTDDISRSDGFGPECVKKINSGYWNVAPKATASDLDSYGRPWCSKHNSYHNLDRDCVK